ncbi:MAG: O-antigen ligase family protein, partial [Candidatus Zixiibacteriota bacterium]
MTAKSENLFKNGVFFFFALFLFSSAFSIALSQSSFALALLLFVTFAVTTRYNPFPKNVRPFYFTILLYLVWMVVSSLVNDVPLNNLREEWLFGIIPVGIFLFRQKHYRGLLVAALGLGVILVSVYGIVQHYFGVNWFKDRPLPAARDNTFYATGSFSNYLTYGNYLATAALFLISLVILKIKNLKSISNGFVFAAGIVGLLGTLMSYSRTAIAVLPFGILAMTWLKGRNWMISSLAMLVIAVGGTFIFVPQLAYKYEMAFKQDLAGENDFSRLFIWKKSLAMTGDNPVFGVGQGNFEKEYVNYLELSKNENRSRPHAHNDFLNFAAIAGIPGALIFISIWVVLFYKLQKLWHNSELYSDKKVFAGAAAIAGLAFMITSLTEATFADEEVRQLLMAIWAAGLWPLMSDKSADEIDRPES